MWVWAECHDDPLWFTEQGSGRGILSQVVLERSAIYGVKDNAILLTNATPIDFIKINFKKDSVLSSIAIPFIHQPRSS